LSYFTQYVTEQLTNCYNKKTYITLQVNTIQSSVENIDQLVGEDQYGWPVKLKIVKSEKNLLKDKCITVKTFQTK